MKKCDKSCCSMQQEIECPFCDTIISLNSSSEIGWAYEHGHTCSNCGEDLVLIIEYYTDDNDENHLSFSFDKF